MGKEQTNSRFVFASHSAADTWIARQIARNIEECGAEAFLDEVSVHVGHDFEEKILEFLDKSHELVVLITPWALDRPYIWAEIGAAWNRRIPIIAILYGITSTELQERPGTAVFLKKRDLIQLNEIDLFFEQLKIRVGTRDLYKL